MRADIGSTEDSMLCYVHRYLLEHGVAPADVLALLETSNTVDEAHATLRFLESRKVNMITVVTSRVHMPRARLIFEHFFDASLLQFVAVPDGVANDILPHLHAHEGTRIGEIEEQGGVIADGRLWPTRTDKH